jgi:hypothetical protein
MSPWFVAVAALFFSVAPATRLLAHDIPRDVTVQAFAKPEGQRFRLLVRVPLKAIMDIEFPRKERDFVDMERVDQSLRDAAMIWLARKIELYEENSLVPDPTILSTRMALESDRSFESYEQALAHVTGPALGNDVSIFWEQGLLDVLFEYPIRSDQSHFSVHMAFDRLGIRVVTALRFMPPSGVVRPYELEGDAGLIPLDPRWQQAVLRFVNLGFFHILDGTDHLLFLFCLVIPFRRIWTLVPIVTSFTVAHSITLIASAYNYAPGALWFPPLIETLIAMSIVYMALENIVLRSTDSAGASSGQVVRRSTDSVGVSAGMAAIATPHRRWIITFLFGLVHGFGFSFGLQHTMQFAGAHLLTSLLSFNLGVELGQLLVLVVMVPALGLLFRYVVAERLGTIILSALVAHTAWHWMTERYAVLQQFPWPDITAADAATAIRWLMVLIVLAAGAYLLGRAAAASADASDTPHGAGPVPTETTE